MKILPVADCLRSQLEFLSVILIQAPGWQPIEPKGNESHFFIGSLIANDLGPIVWWPNYTQAAAGWLQTVLLFLSVLISVSIKSFVVCARCELYRWSGLIGFVLLEVILHLSNHFALYTYLKESCITLQVQSTINPFIFDRH